MRHGRKIVGFQKSRPCKDYAHYKGDVKPTCGCNFCWTKWQKEQELKENKQ